MGEWRLWGRLDGSGAMGYTRVMLRIPPALLGCALAATGLIGCSLDQSALVPQGDAGVRVLPDSGGDAGADSSQDSGVDSGPDSGSRPDTGAPPDSATPDSGCTPSGTGVELCNSIDDDCNPTTPDGSGDPLIGVPCDGADDDLCDEGLVTCVSGTPVCDDTTSSTAETCNGSDDDCDGMVDEGVTTTYYRDDDRDGYGVDATATQRCSAADGFSTVAGDCDDSHEFRNPGEAEVCSIEDTDCDGDIDEGCACTSVIRGGSIYSFCSGGRGYWAARELCRSRGQDLALIEDATENDFVVEEVYARGLGVAYVGLHDDGHEGDWRGSAEETLTYSAWAPGEPNDDCGRGCDENCGVVGWDGRAASSSWNDVNCGLDFATVCEGPAP